MSASSTQPRTRPVRGWRLFAALFAVLLGGAVLVPAAAATAVPARPSAVAPPVPGGLDPFNPANMTVTMGEAPIAFHASANYVTMDITIVLKDGTRPTQSYGIFLTFNEQGKEEEQNPAICQQVHFNSPEVPPGIYRCTGIITHPGVWEFHGTVDNPALVNGFPQTLKQVTYVHDFTAASGVQVLKMKTQALKYIVEGKTFEVFLLQAHVILAGAWILLALSMAFVALPRLRRTLSVLALHALEVRRGFLLSLLWATFGGTVGTGLYLLGTQTAYQAPYSTNQFSKNAWDKITRLPYAQDYFLLLYAKILIFGVMAAASVVLVIESGRQAQLAQDADALDRDDDLDIWTTGVRFDEEGHVLHDDRIVASAATEGGGIATSVQAKRRVSGAVGVAPRTLWICVWILLVGAASIGVCVTGLKYLHELIESTIAATVLGQGV